jgi:hypothetical protein
MRFRLYSCWQDLPAGYGELLGRAGADDFCLSRAWFETLAATTLVRGEQLGIAGVEADGPTPLPRACLVGRQRERDPAFLGARSFTSLSNYYTLHYAPLVEGDESGAALIELALGLRARRPRYAVLHLEPLAAGTPLLDDLAAALCATGLVTRRYFRFGNWYDDTRGLSFRDYLAGRPGALRHTFRRRSARLARAGAVRLATVRDGAALGPALDAYERSMPRAGSGPSPIRRSSAVSPPSSPRLARSALAPCTSTSARSRRRSGSSGTARRPFTSSPTTGPMTPSRRAPC